MTKIAKVGRVYRESLALQVKAGVEKNPIVFLLSYTKMKGGQLNDFRKSMRRAGARVQVSKNSLIVKSLKELQHNKLAERLKGQTALVYSEGDSVEVSKALINFMKTCETLKVQGGLLEGRILEQEDVKKLSDLPSRQVLLSMLLGAIQSPLTRFAGALNAKTRDLLSILKQLSEKKGGN